MPPAAGLVAVRRRRPIRRSSGKAAVRSPRAAGGILGVMVVALMTAHRTNGFFIFKPNGGWEYCASIAVTAFVIGTIGPGEWSLDHAFDIEWTGWAGAIVAAAVGVGAAVLQLSVSYRPPPTPAPAP